MRSGRTAHTAGPELTGSVLGLSGCPSKWVLELGHLSRSNLHVQNNLDPEAPFWFPLTLTLGTSSAYIDPGGQGGSRDPSFSGRLLL